MGDILVSPGASVGSGVGGIAVLVGTGTLPTSISGNAATASAANVSILALSVGAHAAGIPPNITMQEKMIMLLVFISALVRSIH